MISVVGTTSYHRSCTYVSEERARTIGSLLLMMKQRIAIYFSQKRVVVKNVRLHRNRGPLLLCGGRRRHRPSSATLCHGVGVGLPVVALEPVLVRVGVSAERATDPGGHAVLLFHVVQDHAHLRCLEAAHGTLVALLLLLRSSLLLLPVADGKLSNGLLLLLLLLLLVGDNQLLLLALLLYEKLLLLLLLLIGRLTSLLQ